MSKTQIIQTAPAQTAGNLVLILSNSKYTYAQFKTFHQTVIGMLEWGDLSTLNQSQRKNVSFFINILISLLATPTATALSSTSKWSGNSEKMQSSETVKLNHSKADLLLLLHWIGLVVQRKEITIERLLDEFFAMQLNTPYN